MGIEYAIPRMIRKVYLSAAITGLLLILGKELNISVFGPRLPLHRGKRVCHKCFCALLYQDKTINNSDLAQGDVQGCTRRKWCLEA